MKVIDSDNYAASGIDTFFFPGGEPHARIPKDFGDALLFLKARTWNDTGIGACVLDALGQQNSGEIVLFAPYFPGARQDRSDGQTPITTYMIGELLGGNVGSTHSFDIHSDVTIIDKNWMPSDLSLLLNPNYIIVPDAGAIERCKNFPKTNQFKDFIYCEKHRDFATGKFTGFKMPPLPGVGTYLIVDDICDGGGTFNLLAEEFLKDKYGAQSVLELWVSHGIFSKGSENLHPKISKIYTTDSWYEKTPIDYRVNPRVEVISLQPIIDKILQEYEDVQL